MTEIPQVSIFWLLYVLMAGYLIGWTARHLDTSHEDNWFAIKILWGMMVVAAIFIAGYTVAEIVYR